MLNVLKCKQNRKENAMEWDRIMGPLKIFGGREKFKGKKKDEVTGQSFS